jgi:hypothetical protein
MKNLKNNFYKTMKVTGLLSLIVLVLASCRKDNANPNVASLSNIAFVHASPGNIVYDFKVNSDKSNPQSVAYSKYIDYGLISSGKSEFNIFEKGSNQAAAKSVFDLKPKTAYSIYITDIPSKVNLLLTEDDLSRPATGKAKIRFINLSPDAGSLDLSILGDTTAIFTKTSFKSNTAFLQVNPSTAIGFAISDSTKTSVATSPKYRLEQGKIYTVIAKGLKSAADTTTKLAVGMITNK